MIRRSLATLAPAARCVAFALIAACGPTEGSAPTPATPTAPTAAPPPTATEPPVAKAGPALAYPASRTVDQRDTLHGVSVTDPYRWLEEEKSEEVKRWMADQDALARAQLAKLPERDAIAARLKELFYIDSVSAPQHRGKRFFYRRRHADREKAIVYWKEGKDGAERVLFDPNGWSKDGSLSLGGWQPSWDGKRVAYQVHKNNSDEATLYVMDVASGKRSDVDVIEGAKYASASWTPTGDGFFYTWLPTDKAVPDADRPGFAEIRFHKLGEDPKRDVVMREKTGNPSVFLSAELSEDGHWLVLSVDHGWTSTDVYFRDARGGKGATAGPWTPLVVGSGAHYRVEAYKDRLYVATDEGASRWRIFRVDPKKPERTAWTEVVAERPDATLDSFRILGGKLALSYLKNASSLLQIRDLDGKPIRDVQLDGIGTVFGPVGRQDDDDAYFAFESYVTPSEIRETSIKTGATSLYAKVKVPIDPTPFTVEQVFYESKDKTRVSMFIVHRKDMPRDGTSRLMLYGYGGFLSTETPSFIASIYPWLERGGAFAVPNLRGGGEYGEEWHKGGMLLNKQNVFDDFIAAAEFLVREKYTRSDRLVISGGSNGGLLVGAAVTQRPELFSAALCAVPLLDMVRYHLFGSGKTWISEYGSADDPAQLRALYAYSPYHHVKAGTRYPAVLVLSADSDDRVDPMHARKFTAAMQAASTGGPVLVRIEKNSGHGGADMIKAEVDKGADRYAFALAHTAAR